MSDHGGGHQEAYTALSYLLAGLLFYGGLGWLGDQYFDTRWLTPVGIVLGMALAVVMIVRRYGRMATDSRDQAKGNRT